MGETRATKLSLLRGILSAPSDLLRAQWTQGMPVDRYRNEVRRRGREGMQVAMHNRVRSCGVGVGRIMDQEQHFRPRLQPVKGGGRGENAARRNSAMAFIAIAEDQALYAR